MRPSLLDFDFEEALKRFLSRYSTHIQTLGIAFVINLFVYGQRLFGGGLAADDIARFYQSGGEQASWLGRWFGGIMSQAIFSGPLHILPYFNGLIGIFFITLAGYLTALLFFTEKRFPAIVVTLLCSATPFMIHNMFFSTNTVVFIGIALGVGGLLLAYEKSILLKALGLIMLVLSIGSYQTIIQIGCVVILFRAAIELGKATDKLSVRHVMVQGFGMAVFLGVAFFLSNLVNLAVSTLAGEATSGRYAESMEVTSIMVYVDRFIGCYSIHTQLNFFSAPYSMGVKLFAVFGIGLLSLYLELYKPRKLFSLRGLFFVGFVVSLPVIINLPRLLGPEIPTRAHFTIGWIMAAFFMLSYGYRVWAKNIGLTLSLYLLLFGVLYINSFLYAATRQTDMDIIRANQIVSAIRMHPDYPGEITPMKFRVVGVGSLTVVGWGLHRQSAFATDWSNTRIFEHFTDLNFEGLSEAELSDIKNSVIESGRRILPYPDPSSIFIHENKVVVVIDPDELIQPDQL